MANGPNILGALQRGAQTGGMIQQVQANQAATQRANKLRQLAAGGFPQDRAGQQQMVNRAAAIDPQAAIDWNKHFQGMQKAQVEAEKAAAPSYIANLQGVDSADGFAAAKARLAAEGHDVEDWPEYSPQAVNMVLQKSRILADMKPGEGQFTLGNTRFGAGGEVVAEAAGPFTGDAKWAQLSNELITGDPSTPQYAAAYKLAAAPKKMEYFDESLGQIVRTEINPDMSAYRPPLGMAPAQAPQAPQHQIAAPAALPGAPAGLQQPAAPGVSVQQVTQPKPTEAEKAVDREFGKAHADFMLHGGYADGEKNLNQINRVIGRLESGSDKLTGPLIGSVPDAALARLFPDAADTAEQVAEVTQRNLRLVLGGQFSEREGENLIKRAYNIALPEEINARRMTNLYRAMKQAQDAKFAAGRYFDQHRTMRGYQGTAAAEAQAEFMRATEDLDAIPGVTDEAEVPAAQQGAEEGQTAVNPQTGERIILQNGQWIPVQ